ncbi:MAG: ABC transporter permease [Sporolactobacillus sp.]
MRNLTAMTRRIIAQILRDRRTLAMIILAPLLILTLVWYIFGAKTPEPKLAVINYASSPYASAFPVASYPQMSRLGAETALANQDIDAYVDLSKPVRVHLEGSNPQRNGIALTKIQKSMQNVQSISIKNMQRSLTDIIANQRQALTAEQQVMQKMRQALQQYAPGVLAQLGPTVEPAAPTLQEKKQSVKLSVSYLHGSADLNTFDSFGAAMIGIFVFLFIFMIGGVSFLRERTTGTLDRLIASPIKNYQIIGGYMIGFGLFAIIQSAILTCYLIYVLRIYDVGRLPEVMLIVFILSFSALSLSILLSTAARNELQMFQFIPLVIVPQVFLSGLFPIDTLPKWVQVLGNLMPIHYSTEALRNIMIRGTGVSGWWLDALALTGFSLFFITLNIFVLRRSRPLAA